MDRRGFLKTVGAAGAAIAATDAAASGRVEAPADSMGVLVDLTLCIGCRKCEWACNQVNGLPQQPLEAFEDKSVFTEMRRPAAERFTVVNEWENEGGGDRPVWAKVQCMHCNDPACLSACIVTAFSKREDGAVVYDPWRCMGCRYCMVACPFQIPGYEYFDAASPEVKKCEFCKDIIAEGGRPGCVDICPVECLTFGRREDLLSLAHDRIRTHPDSYVDHVYGEHEVGGTAWLYIAGQEFDTLGFPTLPDEAPPRLTERIQHGIFKGFIPPLALYALLGQAMWMSERRQKVASEEDEHE